MEIPDGMYLPSAEDVDLYRENGYWLSPKILDDDELVLLRDHHQKIVEGHYETGREPLGRNFPVEESAGRLAQINNVYWCDSAMARLALSPTIGAIAARLCGAPGVRLWHDQLINKPPQAKASANVGWHQDYGYWQCVDSSEMLTAWVALVDVNEENGCMYTVPGSHKWGLLPEGDFFEQDLTALQAHFEKVSGQPFRSEPCILPAGSVSFHHCLTIHGSGPNLSSASRRSLVVHLLPDGARYRAGTGGDAHSSVKLLGGQDGDLWAGPYFPLLYREGENANPWSAPSGRLARAI